MTITQSSTYELTSLVTDLDLAVRSTRGNDLETVQAVCTALQPALSSPDLLLPEHRIGDPAGYRSHLLHVAPDGAFSLVALVWLPGQATAIHDHLSWCVVGVHEGAEYETRYLPTPSGELVASDTTIAYPGEVAGLLPPGDIHRVHNAADGTAISLHVYGADLTTLGSSIRRAYPIELVSHTAPPRDGHTDLADERAGWRSPRRAAVRTRSEGGCDGGDSQASQVSAPLIDDAAASAPR